MFAYHALEDFERISPELVGVVDFNETSVDFDYQTMVGHFMTKLTYHGPDIRIGYVIERENSVEVLAYMGTFLCDGGGVQAIGDNAPYLLSVFDTYGKQVNFSWESDGSCNHY